MNGGERTVCDCSLLGMSSFLSVAPTQLPHPLLTPSLACTAGDFSILVSVKGGQKTIAHPRHDAEEQRQKPQDERIGQDE